MPLKSCIECGRLTNQTRCPKHERAHREQRRRLGLTGERGSTRAGRKRRARVLARARHRCLYCSARAAIADHFIPLALGGSDDEENLVAACVLCNSAKADQHPSDFLRSEWLKERGRTVASS